MPIRYVGQDRQITWFTRKHLSQIAAIEQQSFADPRSEEDIIEFSRITCHETLVVVDANNEVVECFISFELRKKSIHVIRMAVRPIDRRTGVGSMMMQRMKSKLHNEKRTAIVLRSPVANWQTNMFFAACGMSGVSQGDDVVFRWFI